MRGVTLLELVIVITVVGILAAVAIPRVSMSPAGLDAAARKVQSDLLYAQSLAMGRGVNHGILFVANAPYVLYQGVPASPISDPLTHQNFSENLIRFSRSRVTTNLQVEFDPIGRPVQGGGATLTVANGALSRLISITNGTGRVLIQ